MKIYFIRRNNRSMGPFNLGELKLVQLSKTDLVWRQGLKEWTQAENLSELTDIWSPTTPFTKNKYSLSNFEDMADYHKTPFNSGKSGGWIGQNVKAFFGFLGLVLLGGALIFNYTESSGTIPDTEIQVPVAKETMPIAVAMTEPEKPRKLNPLLFLRQETSLRSNLFGEKIIEGIIRNTHGTIAFQDVVLQVCFLSKTGAIIGNRDFIINDEVTAGSSTNFKFKTSTPSGTKRIVANIIGAGSE